jgi:hypothetical protein
MSRKRCAEFGDDPFDLSDALIAISLLALTSLTLRRRYLGQ